MKKYILAVVMLLQALVLNAQWSRYTTTPTYTYLTTANNADKVGIGPFTGAATPSPLSRFEVSSINNPTTSDLVTFSTYSATYSPTLRFYRSRGTMASVTNTSASDIVADIMGSARINAGIRDVAAIRMTVGASPGTTSYPGYITFHTTNTNTTALAERMRIKEDGNVTLNGNLGVGTSTPTVKLDVVGGGGATMRLYDVSYYPATLEVTSSGLVGIFQTSSSRVRMGSRNSYPLSLITNDTEQVTILTDGKVGVGTTTPTANLHVNNSNADSKFILQSGTSGYSAIIETNAANVTSGFLETVMSPDVRTRVGSRGSTMLSLATNNINRLNISTGGNVGIGAATPLEKLHIAEGNIIIDNSSTPMLFTGVGPSELNRYLRISNSPALANPSGLKAGGVLIADSYDYANPAKNDLVVKGKVAIGTPLTTNPNSYVLAVNGKIGGKDLQLETSSWPDYVFSKTYELPSLKEVEQYIQENKHLKDVPSAEEVKANGYSVNEMNEVLLKKVEELTLYVIEQQKQIDELKKDVKKKKRK